MKWINRERVKVDRVACPWLIQKFIGAQAELIVYGALYAECPRRVASGQT